MISLGKATLSILLFFLAFTLCAGTAWADVVDDCDSISGPGSYQNLSPADQNYIRWNNPPDSSYLCQQSNRRTASAVYRCSDAAEVTVAVYSRYGSYAGYDGGELVRGGEELPLLYQSSTGEVYCDGRRMVYDAETRQFVFLEEEGRPSGLTEYGLSVYCSADGNEYFQMPVQLISASREGPGTYWYEVYRADLEEGTSYLQLVLTDQSSIEILGREERYQFETVGGLSLAWVEIVEEENGSASQETAEGSEQYDDESWYSDEEWEEWDDWDEWDDWEDWDDWDDWEDWDDWGERDDWEDWGDWEEDISGTGGLPAYQPGEEVSGMLLWGPEEEPEEGEPAFPDEIENEEEPEEQSPEKAASGGGSSASGSPTASSESQPQQKKTAPASDERKATADEDIPEAVRQPAEVVQAPPAVRRETPLWRRVTEPDAMTMIIISAALLAMGIRILWENTGGGRERYRERDMLAEREARYARYSSYDRDLRYPSDSRPRPPRGRRPQRSDEGPGEDWGNPEDP